MKKTLLAAALIAVFFIPAFAQSATVAIQNEEGTTFFYTVDPQDLAQLSPGSPLAATRVAEFFAAQSAEPPFVPLAPGAQASLTGLSDGSHLLVGFFATKDQDTFPVRVITLQADSRMGERFYAIYGSPAIVEATRGVGRLAQFAGPATSVQAQPAGSSRAETTQAPQAAPAPPQEQAPPAAPASQAPSAQPAAAPLVSFPASYNPALFTREAQGGFSVQPIASSRSWTLRGTRITGLDARIDRGILKLSLTAADGFSPDVSYFIYAFASRAPGTPAIFTLELRPRALPDRGACLLWQRQTDAAGGASTAGTPSIFGAVTVEGTTATLVADLKDVQPSFLPVLASATSFDLTSCRFDRTSGVYEEFYFTTVALTDIPVTR